MNNQELIESLENRVAYVKAVNEAGFKDKIKGAAGKVGAGAKNVAGKVKTGAANAAGKAKQFGANAAGKAKQFGAKAGASAKAGAGKVAGAYKALPKAGKAGVIAAGIGAAGLGAAALAKKKKKVNENLNEDFDMSRFSN